MNKDILRALGFSDEVQNVELGLCPTCNRPIYLRDYTDELSLREYKISGMCQECQDEIFGKR